MAQSPPPSPPSPAARGRGGLRKATGAETRFLATLAHELRNPLAPLRNGLHLLRHNADPALRARVLAMMDRQVTLLSRLVEDLLDMSRIRAGKLTLRLRRMDLRDAIDQAIEVSEPQIRDAGHHFEVGLPPTPLWVDIDPTRLCQVLSNLLNNAARYTPGPGHIRLRAAATGDEAVVQVSDDGLGIPPEDLSRIFGMFTQLGAPGGPQPEARQGLGIGLALVHALVSLHGGRVEAASAGPDQGSTFTVRLPLAPAPLPAAVPALDRVVPARPPPLQVLVVDDNADAAESLALLLEMDGHVARIARDGPQALASAQRDPPDVVLLDIGLPGMDGCAVASELRARTAHEKRPPLLVALTGWGAQEDRSRTQAAGFVHHLTKPADLEALRAVLAGVRAPA